MEIKLGQKIKSLRKQKNISQEVLAQAMGVTFQAVSKWETGAAMPDVAMIPVLAGFFGVSTDELFDFNLLQLENKIMAICADAAQYRFTDPARSEDILREGLKQYPGSDIILNNLLYTMQTPDRNEEVVTVCKSILEVTRDDEVKYDVLRILAKTYRAMGQQALVKPTLDQIPELYFTKLELNAKLLDGAGALNAAEAQAGLSRDSLLDMLSRAAELCREQGDAARAADYADLARKTYALFEDRADSLSYLLGRRQAWLAETFWPRLNG